MIRFLQIIHKDVSSAASLLVRRGGSSTSTLGGGGSAFSKGGRSPKKIVSHMYKFAVFDIKPTYKLNH